MSVTDLPPAGWYADPEVPNVDRFWSGTAWSDQRRAHPAASDQTPVPTSATQLPMSGWYANPENANCERFWSGTAWSDERRPLPAALPHGAAPEAALEVRARELSRHLEPGEQMRAIGSCQSGGNVMELPKPTFFTMRNWLVGITDRRVILAKVGRLHGDVLPDGIFSVPRQDVVLKGRQLHVTSRDRKVPKRLVIIPFSGFDKDEFSSALTR